ncbi:hypothetical protein BDQ12DRAFT_738692 [Crucibulum laeve]|uniref:Uncharacterized protein n=1 Tax=Crucibulum laeve TaxID=68775 RepID=A0A5C3LKF9_9AGAR|nr:hypothetical protein BDQ12DRAFT_738692 [Crucibulum laeve]
MSSDYTSCLMLAAPAPWITKIRPLPILLPVTRIQMHPDMPAVLANTTWCRPPIMYIHEFTRAVVLFRTSSPPSAYLRMTLSLPQAARLPSPPSTQLLLGSQKTASLNARRLDARDGPDDWLDTAQYSRGLTMIFAAYNGIHQYTDVRLLDIEEV